MSTSVYKKSNINIKDVLFTNPNLLNEFDSDVVEVANHLLPLDTGFEIECNMQDSFDIDEFREIPYIKEVNCGKYEQRFRIPYGIKGFKCLYDIAQKLPENSLLNLGSGIHYHIDFGFILPLLSNSVSDYNLYKFISSTNSDIILDKLDTWNYKGTYNTRRIGNKGDWVNLASRFHTIEYRIGEMTFDYPLLLKRILHCQELTIELAEMLCTTKAINHTYLLDSVTKNNSSPDTNDNIYNEVHAILARKLFNYKYTHVDINKVDFTELVKSRKVKI